MRISDWSSDVCSSDLNDVARHMIKSIFSFYCGCRLPDHCAYRRVDPDHTRFLGNAYRRAVTHHSVTCLDIHNRRHRRGFIGRLINLVAQALLGPAVIQHSSEEHTSELHSIMSNSYA